MEMTGSVNETCDDLRKYVIVDLTMLTEKIKTKADFELNRGVITDHIVKLTALYKECKGRKDLKERLVYQGYEKIETLCDKFIEKKEEIKEKPVVKLESFASP